MIFPLSSPLLPKVMYSPGYPCCCDDECVGCAEKTTCIHCWDGIGGAADPADMVIDIGVAAPLTNTGNCDTCDDIAGEYTLAKTVTCGWRNYHVIDCDGWFITNNDDQPDGPYEFWMSMFLNAVHDAGTDCCKWEFYIGGFYRMGVDPLEWSDIETRTGCEVHYPYAFYESSEKCELKDMVYPINLTKTTSDVWCPECTGTFPATITLDEAP